MLLSCGQAETNQEAPAPEQESSNVITLSPASQQSIHLETATPLYRLVNSELNVNGVLDVPPDQKLTWSLPYGGKISHIPLINGMKVKKGSLLFEMEDPAFIEMQEQYLKNKADLEVARMNFERQETLAKEKVSAQKELEDARNLLTRTEASYIASSEKLRLLNYNPSEIEAGNLSAKARFYADKDYWVKQVYVNLGSFVQAGSPIIDLLDLSHLHLELKVFEKDLLQLEIGQKIRFRFQHESDYRTASVYLIGKSIENDRTVHVHGHLDSEEGNLLPGIFIHAVIETGGDSAWTLPASAMQVWQGKNYLFAKGMEANQFEMMEIPDLLLKGENIVLSKKYQHQSFVTHGTFELLSYLKNEEEEE